jgi:hypothetical protein
MAQFRGVYECDPGPTYERTVSEAHKLLKKAADRWATSHPEEPTTHDVLAQLLELFRKRQFLRLPTRSTVDPFLLTWNEGSIPKLARVIDTERADDRLPILADALEEAGCRNALLLTHCREPGPHLPGCWVVDHLLGRTTLPALEEAHRALHRAALEWALGNPEDPPTEDVLRQVLARFIHTRVLRPPFGARPS